MSLKILGGGTKTNTFDDVRDILRFNGVQATVDQNHNVPRRIWKDITAYYQDGTLWDRIHGTNGFGLHEDVFAGDYFTTNNTITAYNLSTGKAEGGTNVVQIYGIDSYLNKGDLLPDALNPTKGSAGHHLVMGPKESWGTGRMNSSDTTSGAYKGSEMYTSVLGTPTSTGSIASSASLSAKLLYEFGTHLITFRILASFSSSVGAPTSWSWESAQTALMTNEQVFGNRGIGSSFLDIGEATSQLPLFQFCAEAVNPRVWYWLRNVAINSPATDFAYSHHDGLSGNHNASSPDGGVRSCFIIS